MTQELSFTDNSKGSKFTLAWVHPRERILIGWENVATNIYKIKSQFYINNVLINKSELSLASDQSLVVGQYYFNNVTKELYIFSMQDPRSVYVVVEYRMHFSNRPINLSWDLTESGREVEYLPIIEDGGKWTEQVDGDTAIGKIIKSSGKIKLNNSDKFFDTIFDRLIWDDAKVVIFTWKTGNEYGEERRRSTTLIIDKQYGTNTVSFDIKSNKERLFSQIPLNRFKLSDGVIPNSLTGRVKRRVYGLVDGLHLYSMSQVMDGYGIAGTFSANSNSNIFTGLNSDTLNDVTPEDYVYITVGNDVHEYVVETVQDNGFTVTEELEESYENVSISILPNRNSRKKNRKFHIAGHELKEFKATITGHRGYNRFYVDSIENFDTFDTIYLNGQRLEIRSLSRTEIVTSTNVNVLPNIGDEIIKVPVQSAYIEDRKLVYPRDYSLENNGESKLVISDMAEVNIAPVSKIRGTNLTFTDGSRTVTGVDTKFIEDVKPRDWIKVKGKSIFFEVLQVIDDQNLELVTAYNEGTISDVCFIKRPKYIGDETPVICSAYGKTKNGLKTGDFIKTVPDAILDLCKESGISDDELNLDSFEKSKKHSDFLVSMSVPELRNQEPPEFKDVINKLLASVFGAIYSDLESKMALNILYPIIGENVLFCTDSDKISFTVDSSGREMLKTVNVNYRPFQYDRLSKEDGFVSFNKDNDEIINTTNIQREKSYDVYLYKEKDARTIGNRISFLRESPNLVLKVKSKNKFANSKIGDVVICEFDKLFERLGKKSIIGVITKITDNDNQTDVNISDFSGWFNKVARYAKSGSKVYSQARHNEKQTNGFYTDQYGVIDNQPETYKRNLYL